MGSVVMTPLSFPILIIGVFSLFSWCQIETNPVKERLHWKDFNLENISNMGFTASQNETEKKAFLLFLKIIYFLFKCSW